MTQYVQPAKETTTLHNIHYAIKSHKNVVCFCFSKSRRNHDWRELDWYWGMYRLQ